MVECIHPQDCSPQVLYSANSLHPHSTPSSGQDFQNILFAEKTETDVRIKDNSNSDDNLLS